MTKKILFTGIFLIFGGRLLYSSNILHVPRTDNPPVIDGEINDEAWLAAAKTFKGVIAGWTNFSGKLIDNQRVAFVCYDGDNLYAGVKIFVENIERVVSKGPVWLMDAVEIHIENEDADYFHFLAACSGDKDAVAYKPIDFKSAGHISRGLWSVEISIPWKEINIVPAEGVQIGFNIMGYDYKDKWITFGPSFGGFWLPDAHEHTRKGTPVSLWMMKLQ